MDMHYPARNGENLAGWIDDLGLSVTAFAKHLGISRAMLSCIFNGQGEVTADMDLRLSGALGAVPGYWLKMQTQRSLWLAAVVGERPGAG